MKHQGAGVCTRLLKLGERGEGGGRRERDRVIESEEVGTCSYLTCTRGEGGKDPLFHSYYYYYMHIHVHEHNLLQFAYQTTSLPLQGEER